MYFLFLFLTKNDKYRTKLYLRSYNIDMWVTNSHQHQIPNKWYDHILTSLTCSLMIMEFCLSFKFVSSFKFLYNDDLNHLVFLLENDDDNGEWLEFKDLSRLVDILNHIMTHILDIVYSKKNNGWFNQWLLKQKNETREKTRYPGVIWKS